MRRILNRRSTTRFCFGAGLLSAVAVWGCEGSLGFAPRGGEENKNAEIEDTGEAQDLPHNIDRRYSPLAQLTNQEYVAALGYLLQVPVDGILKSPYANTLPSEAKSQGLVNASNRQAVTQLAISGYAGLSTAVAEEFLKGADADGVAERLACDELAANAGAAAADYSTESCIRDFGVNLLQRGFRGAFEDDDVARLDELMKGIDQSLAGSTEVDAVTALVLRFEAVVQLVALSPKFVLLVEKGELKDKGAIRPLTAVEIANRIAFFLTGGPADEALLQQAKSGALNDAEGRVKAIEGLLSTPESSAGAVDILVRWLGVDEAAGIADQSSIDQLRTFLQTWVVEQRPFSDFYSAPFPVQLVDGLESEEEFGVLGSRAVIASNTSAPTPSFINRGEFITERLLCAKLPEDLPDAALTEDVTTAEEVFEVHAREPCATCHHVFDNYGAALQRFDLDSNLYDPAGDYLGTSFELTPIGDVSGTVSQPQDLGATIAQSSQAQGCMAKLWYRHAIRRDLLTNGADDEHVEGIVNNWASSDDTSLRSLLRLIVADDGFVQLFP